MSRLACPLCFVWSPLPSVWSCLPPDFLCICHPRCLFSSCSTQASCLVSFLLVCPWCGMHWNVEGMDLRLHRWRVPLHLTIDVGYMPWRFIFWQPREGTLVKQMVMYLRQYQLAGWKCLFVVGCEYEIESFFNLSSALICLAPTSSRFVFLSPVGDLRNFSFPMVWPRIDCVLRTTLAFKSNKNHQDYLRNAISFYAADACLWVPTRGSRLDSLCVPKYLNRVSSKL